jgi:mRNA interferase RelE/StbE
MKVIADKSFKKDIQKLDTATKKQISNLLIQLVQVESIKEISNFKKIKGFRNAFRIRLGNYRIGIRLDGNSIK